MEVDVLHQVVAVIRNEMELRVAALPEDPPGVADDIWLFTDGPFVNDLCLAFLVSLRHHVDSELILLAARAGCNGKELSTEQYAKNVKEERQWTRNHGWEKLYAKLKIDKPKWMEVLCWLANSYKHNPELRPDDRLIEVLGLEAQRNYAPLTQSCTVQVKVAALVGLGDGATYCDIADRFIDLASAFISKARSEVKPSAVNRSFNPDDAEI